MNKREQRRLRVSCWRQFRALAISLTLLATFTLLLPGGARLASRKVWKTELNQSQFADWARALTSMGYQLTPRELEDALWSGVQRYLGVRDPIVSLLTPVLVRTGWSQSWRMFSNPQTHPARLQIELDTGHGFRPVYVSRSSEFTWKRREFDHNRTRKLFGRLIRKGRHSTYLRFGRWVTQQMVDEYPDTRRVRLRLYRWRTPPPEHAGPNYDANGRFESQRVFDAKGRLK